MKKLIYITSIAFLTALTCGETIANSITIKENAITNLKTVGEPVYCRVVPGSMEVFVIFHGPYLRTGDDITVQIFDADNGALIQQEFLIGTGGGAIEKFSIEGLEAGSYNMVVEGEVYYTEHSFVIP